MLLELAPSISLLNTQKESLSVAPLFSSSNLRFSSVKTTGFTANAAKNANNSALTGVVFAPFEEVKKELDLVPTVPQVSLARQKYTESCEAAINEQIK